MWQGCKKSTSTNWPSDAEKASYEEVISVQNNADELLNGWFQTMDSVEAINKVYDYFVSDPSVSYATINSQGIAVQYENGIRGGLMLNPKDDISEVGKFPGPASLVVRS